jgi:hypothetical protein
LFEAPPAATDVTKNSGFHFLSAEPYPGIRHAGTPASQIRHIEMKDMVSVAVLLSGFLPYLSPQHDANRVYLG